MLISLGIVVFLLTLLSYYRPNFSIWSSSFPKKIDIDHEESKSELTPLPAISLLKALSWALIFGKCRIVSLLKYVGARGPILEFKVWNARFAIINNVELGKEVLKNQVFWSRPQLDGLQFFSEGKYGFLTPSATRWKEARGFCVQHLRKFGLGTKAMEPCIQNETQILINSWLSKRGQRFSPNKEFYIPVMNSLLLIMTGERASEKAAQLMVLFYQSLQQTFQLFSGLIVASGIKRETINKIDKWTRIFPGIRAFQKSIQGLELYFKEIIGVRRKYLNIDEEPRNLVEAYLIECDKARNPDSVFFGKHGERHLVATIFDFLVGGGDTTAVTLAWSMLQLIRNPDIQERIWREIDSVVGRDRSPTLSDRINCPYTTAFISEVIRFHPIVLPGMPHFTSEDTLIGTNIVRKNTTVLLNIYSIHHDPLIWGDPENFRPTRFLSADEKTVVKKDAMCAFSVGIRRCPGEQLAYDSLFIFLSAICQRFEVKCDPLAKSLPTLCDENSCSYTPRKFYMVAIDRFESS